MTTHLTSAYRWTRPDRASGERLPRIPVTACGVTACGADSRDQVSIYPDGDGEDRIDCPACLDWLRDGDNRLMILNVTEWIRRHARDRNLYYMDIPVPE